MKRHWQFFISVALLAATALLLGERNSAEVIAPRPSLSTFPKDLAGWQSSSDISLTKDVLDVLGRGDFLLRDYRKPGGNALITLFIAYFPSQRAGDTIHSPKNCLPGSGWAPVKADHVMISVPGHAPFAANRYLIAKGDDRQLVLYWYWAHDRAVASEYAAKFYLVTDSIRMHRTDGSLIRVSTPLAPNETLDQAEQTLVGFAGNVVPLINTYVPR